MNPHGLALQKTQSLNIILLLIHEPKAKYNILKVIKDCGGTGQDGEWIMFKEGTAGEPISQQQLWKLKTSQNEVLHVIKDSN